MQYNVAKYMVNLGRLGPCRTRQWVVKTMFPGAIIQEPYLLAICLRIQQNILQISLQREAYLLCIHPAHTTRSGESRSTNWAKSLSYSLRASCSSTPGFLYLTRLSRYLSVLLQYQRKFRLTVCSGYTSIPGSFKAVCHMSALI